MAILDQSLTFAQNFPLGAVGTKAVGAALDISNQNQLGGVAPMFLEITFGSGVPGSGTVEFRLQTSSDGNFPTSGTGTVQWASGIIAEADRTMKSRLMVALPWTGKEIQRYLVLTATVAGSALNTGGVNAHLTLTPQNWRAMPEAVS